GQNATDGCYLSLAAANDRVYLYGYLNNDVTGDDNAGKCRPGTAYPQGLRNDQSVHAGDPIGYVGNSRAAAGGLPQLWVSVEDAGAAVDANTLLVDAVHLLFATRRGSPFAVAVTGTVVRSAGKQVTLRASRLRLFPSGATTSFKRTVTLTVGKNARFERRVDGEVKGSGSDLLRSSTHPVELWTSQAATALDAQEGS